MVVFSVWERQSIMTRSPKITGQISTMLQIGRNLLRKIVADISTDNVPIWEMFKKLL